jgi:predicted ATPase
VIKTITMENFRGLPPMSLGLDRWNALYGPNGSGKTNVLDAINYISRPLTRLEPLEMSGVYSFSRERGNEGPDIAFSVSLDDTNRDPCRYLVRLTSGKRYALIAEEIWVNDERARATAPSPVSAVMRTAVSDDVSDEPPDSNERWIRDQLKYVRRYSIDPASARLASPNGQNTIRNDGVGLPSALDDLGETSPDRLAAISEGMGRIFKGFRELRLSPYSEATTAIEFRIEDRWFNGARLSDGMASTLALLFLASSPRGPQLIMLDEPESKLSPIAVMATLDTIDTLLDDERQILLTTHSPHVLKWLIHRGEAVSQMTSRGPLPWQEILHLQGIKAETIHTDQVPISTNDCVGLLESFFHYDG